MEEETLMLLSMKDSKAVATALSNETAQKILAYITENKEATESELSEKLDIPLPTVHYNIQQLKKANLLKTREFFWSKKGKKMRVFTLAKKYIIIAPGKSSLKELKGILPVAAISLIGAGLINFYQKSKSEILSAAGDLSRESLVMEAADKTLPMADGAATNMDADCIVPLVSEPNLAIWFLAGSLLAIILVLAYNLIKKNK
jgi:DNA-binding transcriptional ArsR family regulator